MNKELNPFYLDLFNYEYRAALWANNPTIAYMHISGTKSVGTTTSRSLLSRLAVAGSFQGVYSHSINVVG